MFAEAVEDILRDKCTLADVRRIESQHGGEGLWAEFVRAGFLDLFRPESEGGAGLPLAQAYPIIQQFGRYAAPLPFAQAVAARAIVGADVVLPDDTLTFAAQFARGAEGDLTCAQTPFGLTARYVLAADGERLLLLDAATARRSSRGDSANHVATLTWADESSALHIDGDGKLLAPTAAGIHAALIAGAMSRVFEMTLSFCNDRQQFGKPLGKFQSIQHQLSVMAEQVAAVSVAAEAAFEDVERTPSRIRCAMAKSRASEAVVLVANTAHALHGAIGITEEYDLQLFTRRLHEWRMAHGAEQFWNRMVGIELLATEQSVAEFVRMH